MQKNLNANQLKFIAIVAMTADHLTWTLFPGYDTRWFVVLLHLLGRLTAPIMWFFIVEGYANTRNVGRYAGRLFLLAFVSHFAYNFCFNIPFLPFRDTVFNQTGVVWSLAWGLVLLCLYDRTDWKPWQKMLATAMICLITFPSDWSCVAAMAILFMGQDRGHFSRQMFWLMAWSGIYALVYFFFIDKTYAFIQLGTCLTIPLLAQYNGQRGGWKGMGKLFYAYYPAHLVLCGILRILLWGTDFVTATGALSH